jgi:thiol-disulfide isomerase/thioredoxin
MAELRTDRALGARGRRIAASILVLAALAIAGCGSSEGGDLDGSHPDYERALAGSPPALAALHKQGNELLPGAPATFEERIEQLKGFPVVVNLWASWCGPCRLEFPMLQNLSADYGRKVAFLGVNVEDTDGFASRLLEEAPVPFPSYTDPDADIKQDLGARGLPDTAYYRRDGELCFVNFGQYADEAEMRADVESHALAEEGCEGA